MMGYGTGIWAGGSMMILIWIGIAVLAVWGLRTLTNESGGPRRTQRRPAEDIAAQRYARGEMTRDEYLSLLDDLEYLDEASSEKQKRSDF